MQNSLPIPSVEPVITAQELGPYVFKRSLFGRKKALYRKRRKEYEIENSLIAPSEMNRMYRLKKYIFLFVLILFKKKKKIKI